MGGNAREGKAPPLANGDANARKIIDEIRLFRGEKALTLDP
jgi:hypothetical protein